MDKLFLEELNGSCENKNKVGWCKWDNLELEYIKKGLGRDYCQVYYTSSNLCESCRSFQIRIRNFYSDIDITDLHQKVLSLLNKHL